MGTETTGETASIIQQLRAVMTLVTWRMRPRIVLLLIGSIALALVELAAVMMMVPVMQIIAGQPIDRGILASLSGLFGTSDRAALLIWILSVMIVLLLAKNVCVIAFRWWSLGLMAKAQSDANRTLFGLYASSSYVDHRRRQISQIQQTITVDLPTAFNRVLLGLVQMVVDLVMIVAILATLVVLSPAATLLAVALFGGAALGLQRLFKHRLVAISKRADMVGRRGWRYIGPVFDGFTSVRVADETATFVDEYADSRAEGNELNRQVVMLTELPRYLFEVLLVLGLAGVAGVLFATDSQSNAFAFLGVFALGAVRTVPTLNRVFATMNGVRSGQAQLESLYEQIVLLRNETGREEIYGPVPEFGFGDIVFDDVSFQFPDGDTPVLDRVSGIIESGKMVALVGASGAGKTTFADILLGLLAPTHGSVTVEGRSIHEEPRAWRRQLGMVAQSVYILDATIAENVAFERDLTKIDEQRLSRALAMAQLEDFVSDLPEGTNTRLGHQGARLSGGQRQRIGIARALYRAPQLLVLDEATSALDNETEARIAETIDALRGTMTLVVVAHRLSTVKNADTILFFSDGKIVDRGTMAELAHRCDEFSRLVELGKLS